MDLSTLDPTQPSDGQAVSQGALRIRETRDATRTSFNVEHALAGAHRFLSGALGSEPAAGNAGRLFINTTQRLLERDTGVVWQTLHTVQPNIGFFAGPTALGPAPGYHILVNLGIIVPPDSSAIIYGQFQAGTQQDVWQYKLQVDGFDLTVPGVLAAESLVNGQVFMLPIAAIVTGLSSGNHTFTLFASASPNATNVFNSILLVVIC